MKHLIRYSLAIAVLSALIHATAYADKPAPGFVDFGKFFPPASGGEFVEVNVNSTLISMAVRLVEKDQPEVAELLRGLQLVRVNVIGLNEDNRAEIVKRVKTI